ncbi:MAG: hypothetical protein JO323_19985 [Acidobacteriia bacterium]|nr:hypothetical protein [Terriglobia bacterium]
MTQKHFTDERWSDYVRGLSPAPDAAAIHQHLEAGCEPCERSFRFWTIVAEVANSEAQNEVSEGQVRISRSAYLSWWRGRMLPQRATMARLLFDSMLAPLPAGVRGHGPSSRRILGRAGQWSLDLRFEPSPGKHLFLVGQILGPESAQSHKTGFPVLLMSPDALVAETTANQFGEFQLQLQRANGLRIYADVPGRRPIGMSLPDLQSPLPPEDTPVP